MTRDNVKTFFDRDIVVGGNNEKNLTISSSDDIYSRALPLSKLSIIRMAPLYSIKLLRSHSFFVRRDFMFDTHHDLLSICFLSSKYKSFNYLEKMKKTINSN